MAFLLSTASGVALPGLFGVGRSRRPRRIGHLLENLPQHTRRAHPLREGQPQRRAIELKLETLGVAAHAAPFAVASAHELGSIETHRLGMIAVHMRNNLGLGRDKLAGVTGLGQDVLRLEIDDAAEPGDEMRGLRA